MKRAFLFSSGITAIIVGVFALAYLTSAGVSPVAFTGQGTVRGNTVGEATMDMNFTQLSERAQALGLGNLIAVRVSSATFHKRAADGTLRRIKQGNIAVGDRVTVRGTVRSNDRFVASRIEVVDTGFVMTGKLRTFNRTLRRMTVDVTTSTYKSARYKDKTVELIFSEATKYFTQGVGKSMEDVTASDQKVRVQGREVGTDLEVTSMNENVP
ncbi:MAG: hypothetical protein Q8R32_03225 [bacterium]|nr:hypothetical protein [bacterium]